jgi:hypothetical protein
MEELRIHKHCSMEELQGKAIPLLPLTDPECFRRLRLSDFKIIGT